MERPRLEPVVRHVRQPGAARPDDRRVVERLGGRARRRPLRARPRHRHRLLGPAPFRGLRDGRAEVAVGADLRRTASSRSVRRSTPSGRWRGASGRGADVVGADRPARAGAAPRRAHDRPAPAAARDRRRPPDRAQRPRRGVGRPTSSATAPASSRRGSRSRLRTRGRSSSTRRRSRTRRPSRAARTSTAT